MHLEASLASINKKFTYDDLVVYDKPLMHKAQNSRKSQADSLPPKACCLGAQFSRYKNTVKMKEPNKICLSHNTSFSNRMQQNTIRQPKIKFQVLKSG